MFILFRKENIFKAELIFSSDHLKGKDLEYFNQTLCKLPLLRDLDIGLDGETFETLPEAFKKIGSLRTLVLKLSL